MLRKNLIAVIVMVMCVMGSVLYGIAIGSEGSLFQDELFLDRKGAGYVMADKMRFEINSSTVINDWRGNDITLEELQVPSKAVVEYYKKADQANTSIAVSIKEVLIPE